MDKSKRESPESEGPSGGLTGSNVGRCGFERQCLELLEFYGVAVDAFYPEPHRNVIHALERLKGYLEGLSKNGV